MTMIIKEISCCPRSVWEKGTLFGGGGPIEIERAQELGGTVNEIVLILFLSLISYDCG